ncbi:23S rRNA pseudouridine955/2504/2580 synthase [Methylohalomonas lacus]|uniref:Pseudouridine synthase n=1 Tax=Methylohalomonas lacus TaxID=398773 RepID=A0AAE3HHV1_9GAMM|nr:RluA family pseudouridine synthase [Methylohalomonas lacus]MCS3902625.1 23S rRNA pseudouridine955/2504/2580 synthase [Methylohalomonas lacus]
MPPPDEQTSGVQKVTVDTDENGRRLDNFISSRLKNIPKSRIYQMLRRGEVRVNGSRARPEKRLEAGDVVRLPPLFQNRDDARPVIPGAAIARLEQQILHEDARLLVINKPSGVAVHGGSGVSYGVIDILRASRGDKARLELVHRLDRDTSGCLLLAKDMTLLRTLHDQLRDGQVRKGYLALLRGQLGRRQLDIDDPLSRQQGKSGDRRVVVDAAGKVSATRIRRQRQYSDATLADVSLLTGRTHQIRVHAAAAGHPLAGDVKYGDKAFNKQLRQLGLRRLFLHAASLQLPDHEQAFEAPLPDELQAVLERLA